MTVMGVCSFDVTKTQKPSVAPKAGVCVSMKLAQGVLPALTYATCSVGMLLVNKTVLTTFGYHYHMGLLLWQTLATLGISVLAGRLGYVELPAFDPRFAKAWFPVNLLFLTMLATSFLSLQYLAVPLVTIFKNLTNGLTMLGDYLIFNNPSSKGIIGSLAIMVLASVLTGLSDISFSFVGYFWMAMNCLSTASFVLYMRYVMQSQPKLGRPAMAYYNSLLGIGPIILMMMVLGEVPGAWQAEQFSSGTFIVVMLISGCAGFCIQMASLWCMAATTPTTYAMVGAFNKVPASLIGVMLFDTPMTTQLALFICLGILGSFVFAYVKSTEAAAKKLQENGDCRRDDQLAKRARRSSASSEQSVIARGAFPA